MCDFFSQPATQTKLTIIKKEIGTEHTCREAKRLLDIASIPGAKELYVMAADEEASGFGRVHLSFNEHPRQTQISP